MQLKRPAGIAAVIAVSLSLPAMPSFGQDLRGEIEGIVKEYLETHPDDVGRIAKNYFIQHPEALNEMLVEAIKNRRQQAKGPASNDEASAGRGTAIEQHADALFSSAHQVTLGNPAGDVTLVEFFDYNCGYCRRALGDMMGLLSADPKLKVVLKEFPILGPESVEAARVAIAARMQDPSASKYLVFHQALLGRPGRANKATALAAAHDAGYDTAQIETALDSDEVKQTLDESASLARALGLSGTPSYVVGKDVLVGAVGEAALLQQIKAARVQ